ncbi:acetyl-CoA carboxylase biotin carboxyl carrier protein subunit [Corynebacterium resistens]|uniref:acetyl-CoA carboxylase biotin carboxyl carrier protein subunit n=1 Tax=Corynebacterium resistens TaxID=258224 RepID=UPI0023570596|nr:acetyl-CoA carboxylase biotin carboxyl carrier protein subunit [Corynebacterium resistens]
MNIHAPFAGIVRFLVADGAIVTTGQELAIVEAVKLEAPVLAPGPGRVVRVIHEDFVDVTGGDVLLKIEAQTVAAKTTEEG